MTKTEITPHSIYWIRQDLRVSDNPALAKAAEAGYLAIYIFDDVNTDEQTLPGEATSWWLHNSLKAFNESLDDKISFFRGDPLEILKDLLQHVKHILPNMRCSKPKAVNLTILW